VKARFVRNYIDIGDYLEQIFPFLGIRFISVNDRFDSNDLQMRRDSLIRFANQNGFKKVCLKPSRLPAQRTRMLFGISMCPVSSRTH